MFNDILGEKKKEEEIDERNSLIEAMKYNIKEKEKIIERMTQEIIHLEKELMRVTGGV